MTDFTYDKVAGVATSTPETARKSVWRRIYEAMVAARMRQAELIVKNFHERNQRW